MIDGKQLNDILGHLLDNAVKFTDEGNVTLTSERDGNRLVFTVADTGIGMRVHDVRAPAAPSNRPTAAPRAVSAEWDWGWP